MYRTLTRPALFAVLTPTKELMQVLCYTFVHSATKLGNAFTPPPVPPPTNDLYTVYIA